MGAPDVGEATRGGGGGGGGQVFRGGTPVVGSRRRQDDSCQCRRRCHQAGWLWQGDISECCPSQLAGWRKRRQCAVKLRGASDGSAATDPSDRTPLQQAHACRARLLTAQAARRATRVTVFPDCISGQSSSVFSHTRRSFSTRECKQAAFHRCKLVRVAQINFRVLLLRQLPRANAPSGCTPPSAGSPHASDSSLSSLSPGVVVCPARFLPIFADFSQHFFHKNSFFGNESTLAAPAADSDLNLQAGGQRDRRPSAATAALATRHPLVQRRHAIGCACRALHAGRPGWRAAAHVRQASFPPAGDGARNG